MKPSSQTPVERKSPQELAIELMTTTHLMTNGEADAHRLLDALRDETLTEVTTWLVKKAREFRAEGQTVQADTASILASKVTRGAVRPNNLRMLPDAGFFEVDRTYQRGRWLFEVLAVAPNPFNGEVRAVGYLYRPSEPATATALDPDDWADGGWTEVAEGGAR